MKKLIAIVLAVMLAVSCTIAVSAANATPGTTTLTTTVPDAEYTLNIPADQEIPFGATSTEIGNVTVTGSSGFAVGKNLNVTMEYDVFTAENISTTIPFVVKGEYYLNGYGNQPGSYHSVQMQSGSTITFYGKSGGVVNQYASYEKGELEDELYKIFTVDIKSDDWGKALGGDYTATITFSAEVVVE